MISSSDQESQIQPVPIDEISRDHATQIRVVKIDSATVEGYAADMDRGSEFPPVTLFYDGETYHIGDGFHRVEAASKIKRKTILADVRQGNQRDAMLHAMGANSSHGLRRTQDDKRNAVLTILKDPDWSKWSARQIAAACDVSHTFVNKVKHELKGGNNSTRKRPAGGNVFVDKSGNASTSAGGSVSTKVLEGFPDDVLIAECKRRGWEVSQ